MGFRRGFFLGFLIGSAAASLTGRTKRVEAPVAGSEAAREHNDPLRTTLDHIRQRADEAFEAARAEAEEKERELRRRFDELKGRPS